MYKPSDYFERRQRVRAPGVTNCTYPGTSDGVVSKQRAQVLIPSPITEYLVLFYQK
jgi:hypothetical protein